MSTYPTADDFIAKHRPLTEVIRKRGVSSLVVNAWNHGSAAGHAQGRDAAITQALALVRARIAEGNCSGAELLRFMEAQLPKVCP